MAIIPLCAGVAAAALYGVFTVIWAKTGRCRREQLLSGQIGVVLILLAFMLGAVQRL